MKLASLKKGRDGRLIVVDRSLLWAALSPPDFPTMQAALDDWDRAEPLLRRIDEALAAGEGERFAFVEEDCASPLPRAYQWADGSAYVNHVDLVRRSRGATLPETFWADPLIYQGGSDSFLGPRDPILLRDEAWGIDFEGEIAVITGDVPAGASREVAAGSIKLLMLVNDVSLRNLMPSELGKGFGFFQSKPASAFSPLAVTPDELGDRWDGERLDLPLLSFVNGHAFGKPLSGEAMTFSFLDLILHATKTRALCAGTIVGSGTVSNRSGDGGPGRPIGEGGLGYSCISEMRVVEKLIYGEPRTPFLTDGDHVRIEMCDASGKSIFGAIDQTVQIAKAVA